MGMCHYYKISLKKLQPEKCYYMIPVYLTLFALDKSLCLFCHHLQLYPGTHTYFISITIPQVLPSLPLHLLQSWCLESDWPSSNLSSPPTSHMALASHLIFLYFSICICKVGIMMLLLYIIVMKIKSNACKIFLHNAHNKYVILLL